MERFYYDEDEAKCLPFKLKGTAGNGKHFDEMCENTCGVDEPSMNIVAPH